MVTHVKLDEQYWRNVALPKNILIHHVFLLGVDLFDRYDVSLEQDEYGDLLRADFIEGHYNLSLKDTMFLDYVKGMIFQIKVLLIDVYLVINLPNTDSRDVEI